MQVHSPIFQGQLIAQENSIDNFYTLKKNVKNILFALNKYRSVAHVSKFFFQGLFKNIFFRSVALVTIAMGYFLFCLHKPDFLLTCTQPL